MYWCLSWNATLLVQTSGTIIRGYWGCRCVFCFMWLGIDGACAHDALVIVSKCRFKIHVIHSGRERMAIEKSLKANVRVPWEVISLSTAPWTCVFQQEKSFCLWWKPPQPQSKMAHKDWSFDERELRINFWCSPQSIFCEWAGPCIYLYICIYINRYICIYTYI